MFVFDGDDRMVKRTVRLGDSNYEYVEVLDGLVPGDRVAINDMKHYNNYTSLKVK